MTDSPEDTDANRDTRFKPGQSGNPNGRPKGARNKLGEQFLLDLQELWADEGKACLKEAREQKPMEFAKMIAGILPRELLVRTAPESEMTDDELADAIEALSRVADRLRDGGTGVDPSHGGTKTTH